MAHSLWQLLIQTSNPEDGVHLTCDECFMLLEYDADLLAAGAQLEQIQSAVSQHLALCSECRQELSERLGKLEMHRE
jgi:hypothetical protein